MGSIIAIFRAHHDDRTGVGRSQLSGPDGRGALTAFIWDHANNAVTIYVMRNMFESVNLFKGTWLFSRKTAGGIQYTLVSDTGKRAILDLADDTKIVSVTELDQ